VRNTHHSKPQQLKRGHCLSFKKFGYVAFALAIAGMGWWIDNPYYQQMATFTAINTLLALSLNILMVALVGTAMRPVSGRSRGVFDRFADPEAIRFLSGHGNAGVWHDRQYFVS
jgi:hypothetical protein